MRAASPMIPFQPPISSISGASTNLIPSKDNYSSYKYGGGGGGGASSMMMIQSGWIGSFKGGI